jgi:hypothetical protein
LQSTRQGNDARTKRQGNDAFNYHYYEKCKFIDMMRSRRGKKKEYKTYKDAVLKHRRGKKKKEIGGV